MLPDAEHIQPKLIGQLDLLHQVAHALARAHCACQIRERGYTQFHNSSIAQ